MLIIPQPEDIGYKTPLQSEMKKLGNMNNDISSKISLPQNHSVKHLTATVLSNIHFILLLINAAMFLFGTGVVFTHIMAFTQSQGISSSLGSMMISVLGLSALLGRIGLGMLSQLPWLDTIILYTVAVFIEGNLTLVNCRGEFQIHDF